jgi:putative ABC transport system ATP-binding protein
MHIVQLKEASKTYRLGETYVPALKPTSLDLNRKEFVAVWGPSGSGKSTLCHLVGLVDECTSGQVFFEGVDVSTLSDAERSRLRLGKIGFVFQSFNLLPVLTALENVLLPQRVRHRHMRRGDEKAREIMTSLGLEAELDKRPDQLSGGQQQRVAIARALANDPDLVIADEPTANLDTENAMAFIEIMRRHHEARDTTFVFATHDQRLLEHVDRHIHLRDGVVVSDTHLTE